METGADWALAALTEEPEEPGQDQEKIKKAVLADIQRANAFFSEKCEPVFRTRHQLYEADKAHYKKRFPKASLQSDFVSFDFWSMVQWAIPAVMNSFFGGDEAVVIVGRNGEDVKRAELVKALIDFQIMAQNKGFLRLWDWFSDAFQYGLGALKVWWKRDEDWSEEKLEHVDALRLMELQADPWCQISAMEPDGWGGANVVYRVGRLKENRPVLEPVRVTDLRWSPEARSLDEANFVAQRKAVTADHLRRQAKAGVYETEAVERAIAAENEGVMWTQLELEMNSELDRRGSQENDPARRLYELYECYVKVDLNGDGLLEDAIVTVVGDELLRVEENPWGRTPIFTLAPVRDPFKVLADKSFAEIVGEIQDLKTILMRQVICNTVNANNAKFFIDKTAVDLDDIIQGNPYVRVTTSDVGRAVVPFPQPQLAPWTMGFFESLEGALEQWTGRTRYNQGTDASSLNKTATGITLIQQASEQRIDYIVRVFAETGVGEMLRFLVELDQRYIDQEQVIRLKNEPLSITPDDLRGEFDIDVNTDAGVGKRKQTIQNLQFYLSAIAPFGMQIGAVTPGEWAKAAGKLLNESGIRDVESYVMDPEVVKQQFFAQMAQAMMQQQLAAQAAALGGANGSAGAAAAGAALPGGGAGAALAGNAGVSGGVL